MAKIAKSNAGWQGVRKISKSLAKEKGRLPGSQRVVAGPGLFHKGSVVTPGNLPGSRRYHGSVNQDLDWRDDLIESIVKAAVKGAGTLTRKAVLPPGADMAYEQTKKVFGKK